MITPKSNGWETEFDKKFMPKFPRSGFEPLPDVTGNLFTIKDFIHQAILSAEERAREEERERILDDGRFWFETHFTPEDPEVGMFKGIQEHLGEREFIKLVQNKK